MNKLTAARRGNRPEVKDGLARAKALRMQEEKARLLAVPAAQRTSEQWAALHRIAERELLDLAGGEIGSGGSHE